MTEIAAALYAFWSQFGIPAYISGCVDEDAKLPYITYEVVDGAPFGQTVLTAFVWTDGKTEPNKERVRLLDAIRAQIPYDGKTIGLENGLIVIYPNDSDFISFYDDPEDESIKGGRVSYEVHFYH